jgi:ElaB/YqjD/DUF883 family membrane-anchored ribosome-binding protein
VAEARKGLICSAYVQEMTMAEKSLNTDVRTSVEAARVAVMDGIAHGMDAVRNEAGELRSMAAHGAANASDAVASGIRSANAEADVILDAAKQQGAALQKLIGTELRVHPLRSIGIAAAIGLIVGLLSRR